MFFLYVALLFLVFGLFSLWRFKVRDKKGLYTREQKEKDSTWQDAAVIWFVVSACLVGIAVFVTLISCADQKEDFENLRLLRETEAIYLKKAKDLTQQFAKYLAEAYPGQERFIFDKIAPEKVGLYLVKYPEIKSSETLMALVAEINKLQSQVYSQMIKRAEIKKDIRFRLVNPWRLNFFMAKPPAELMKD